MTDTNARMERLVREMAAPYAPGLGDATRWMREAAAIVAELPEPVDPDIAAADALMCGSYWHDTTGKRAIHALILRGIKLGRELQRGEG